MTTVSDIVLKIKSEGVRKRIIRNIQNEIIDICSRKINSAEEWL